MDTTVRDVILRDGSTLRLRRSLVSDREAVRDFFSGLSAESLRLRFGDSRLVGWEMVDRYIEADQVERVALIGTREHRVVAVGTFDRLRDPRTAEVAFAVADPMQGNGVATRLLEQLAEIAGAAGVEQFVGVVDLSNEVMMSVFRNAGFEVTRHADRGTAEMRFPIAPTEAYVARVDERDHAATVASLRPFFHPGTVAVFGASARAGTIGNSLVRNMLAADFPGAVYPINLRGEPVAGVPAYRTLDEVGRPIDLAVVCVPSAQVLGVTEQALRAGTRAVCVISAGFAEMGTAGAELQQELLELVRQYGARLLGPNCLGIAVPAAGVNATFAPRGFPAGSIGFSSQSGALGLALLEQAAARGIGLSGFVSIGNKADISSNDLLEYWEDDEATRLLLIYVESFGNPRKFARVARRVARKKPVLALKSGVSSAGARAAGSHTAALAGSDAAVEALFREAGVLRMGTLDEVMDVAALLAAQPLPAGNRVGVVTNAGGLGILCADACDAAGLALPPPSPATVELLRPLLPPEASLANPIDMLGSATPEAYATVLPALLADPQLDSIIVLFAPAAPAGADAVAVAVADAAVGATKPVLAVTMTASGPPAAFARPGSPVSGFSYPESAARALGRAVQRSEWLRRPSGLTVQPDGIRAGDARALVDQALDAGHEWLEADQIRELLGCYGLPMVAQRLAQSPEQAARQAAELGFPVAVKLAEAGVHKTERHGVALGLADEPAVIAAATAMAGPVVVQQMITGGVELLAGLLQDPVFGPLVAFGPGGVLAELIGEAAFRIVPITDVDAAEMVTGGKAGRLVAGFRGAPPADAHALSDLLLRLSALAEDVPELAELDMNPVIARGDGCVIVDCRARVSPRGEARAPKTW